MRIWWVTILRARRAFHKSAASIIFRTLSRESFSPNTV